MIIIFRERVRQFKQNCFSQTVKIKLGVGVDETYKSEIKTDWIELKMKKIIKKS